jgi:Fe-S-cluster-containing dehydrogenase component
MAVDRKTFLRIAGAATALFGLKKAARALTGSDNRAARRWAMAVDTRKCLETQDCDLCIRACHRTHNVPEVPDRRRQLKWIWKEPFKNAFLSEQSEFANAKVQDRPFLMFCNHCDRPPCVRICPTQATWKREDGIVMMDWHRCIGCRYCMAACPYGSRSFNWIDPRTCIQKPVSSYPMRTKGVVEKCTFCTERLDAGQPPACVESCPSRALIFGDLEDPASSVRTALGAAFVIRRKVELGTGPEVYYIV